MHRFRSWTLDPPEWRTQRNRILATEGGDGSTLSFDFTGGTLDSRFVFEASTNGTFINSVGNIEYRQQNLFYNTSWNTTTLPTGWQIGPSPTGSAVWDGQGSLTISSNAGQRWFMIPAAPYISTSPGLFYTISIKVLEKTGNVILGDIITEGGVQGGATPTISNVVVYINGSSTGVTTDSPITAGDVVSLSARIGGTATAWYPRFGLGVNNNMATDKSVKFTQPQANVGVGAQSYIINTKTSTPYYGPRFDYDPITLQPRGLLIEPSASNSLQSLDSATWGRNNIIGSGAAGALALDQTGPDNYANSASRITTAATTLPVNQFINASTNAAGSTRTFSVWVRGVGSQTTASISIISNATPGTPANITPYIVGPGSFTTAVSGSTLFGVVTGLSTTKWTRIGISRTDTIGSFDSYRIYVGDATSATNISSGVSVDIYVPQLESGAGMSSTIPTGASTVNRSYDACYVPTTNFTTNTTNWSILAEWEDARIDDATQIQKWVLSTADSANNGTGLFYSESGAFPLGGGVSNSGDATSATTVAISAINKAAFSFVRTPTPAVRMSLNGEDIVTGTQGQPAIPDKLNIGSRAYSSAGRFLSGYIRKIKYWPSLLSDNELKTLSSINYLSPSFDVDFTGMSSLTDLTSRGFTFSRATNATFINSQGLVQYADSNIFYNSSWTDANNTPSAWSAGSGTASRSGETRTFTTSASQVIITQTRNTASGIRYTASVEVTAVTGSQRVDDVIVALGGSAYQYYFNGSAVAGTTTLTPGVVSVAFTAGGATTTVRVGSGVQGTNTTGAVTLRYPQFEPGTVPLRTYRQNDSTTASYEAPRFDYDPITRQPRGLLIEGSSVNYVLRSDVTGFPSPWSTAGTNLPTVTAGYTGGGFSPDGITYPTRLQFGVNAGGSASRLLQATTYATNPTTANPYTVSVWMKSNTAGTNYTVNIYGTTGNNLVTVTPTWQRFQVVNTSGTSLVGYIYISNESTSIAADVSIWGAQLEAGSGASSYIPSGASQGSRAQDSATMAITASQLGFDLYRYTMLVRGRQNTGGTGFARSVRLHDATTEQVGFAVNGIQLYGTSRNASAVAISEVSANNTLGQDFRFAWALDANLTTNTMLGSLNQSALSANRTNPGPMASTTTLSFNTNTAATAYASMTIRDIKFFPTQYTAAQLQALTA